MLIFEKIIVKRLSDLHFGKSGIALYYILTFKEKKPVLSN